MSSFTPAEGVNVIYEEYIGNIVFVGEEYLTLCIRTRDRDMISDVCLLVYKNDWDKIQLIKSSER